MFLDINSEMKLTPENKIVESVLHYIYGGFAGLAFLLFKFNNKYNPTKWKFSHTDFEDFYNGKNIELFYLENEIYVKAENRTITFNNFYEKISCLIMILLLMIVLMINKMYCTMF